VQHNVLGVAKALRLERLWDERDLGDRVVLVLHDWGSALGFDYGRPNSRRCGGREPTCRNGRAGWSGSADQGHRGGDPAAFRLSGPWPGGGAGRSVMCRGAAPAKPSPAIDRLTGEVADIATSPLTEPIRGQSSLTQLMSMR
jgi:hypothetical protein